MKPSLTTHKVAEVKRSLDSNSGKGEELFSHHIFLLPFKWSKQSENGVKKLPTSEDLDVMTKRLKSDWDNDLFDLKTVANYNEWHYFYDYVRNVLYETSSEKEEKRLIRHFRHKHAGGGTYSITTPSPKSRKTPNGKETYDLDIDEVYLHLYDTGVGVLSFHLDNRDGSKSTPEDILLINQYGRRVFPPFYLIPPDKVGTQAAFDLKFGDPDQVRQQPHGKEVAYQITVKFSQGGVDEEHEENWERLQDQLAALAKAVPKEEESGEPIVTRIPDFEPAKFCQPFLKEFDPVKNSEVNLVGNLQDSAECYDLHSVLDDRMFTVCWYGSDEKASDFGPTWANNRNEDKVAGHLTDNWWYQYVFVDGNDKTIDHPALQKELIEKASYLRWAQRGTWYGVTDYSFVILTSSLGTLKKFKAEFLVTHLQSIYYKLVELTLVQRASVQRFSNEVTYISQLDVPDSTDTDFKEHLTRLASSANDLYKRYIRFVNGIYFREVTAQAQGIELYEKLQNQSRLPVLVESLNDEIHELHNYVRQETDRGILKAQKDSKEAEDKKTNLLTLLGALFLAPALLVAVYDLGFYGDCLKVHPNVFYPLTVFAAILTAVLFYWVFVIKKPNQLATENRQDAQNERWRKRLPPAVFMYFILLLLPMTYGFFYCPAPTPPTVVTGEVSITPTEVTQDSQVIFQKAQSFPTADTSLVNTAPASAPK